MTVASSRPQDPHASLEAGLSAPEPAVTLRERWGALAAEESILRQGGGKAGWERQRKLGRLTVRERLGILLDQPDDFFELGLWAGWRLYPEWGETPAASLVTGIGRISGRMAMVVANDATVKAGAMFPQSIKKLLRAQRIAFECSLPIAYLVDSAGVFLPLQDEVFPDEDDFGRIFRNNAVLSAAGIPQIAAVMGNCVAGGAYLPVLCDKLVMTEGSAMSLAGPSLVKAAIGQDATTEELGGAAMHASISGTVDFREKDDSSALARMRSLFAHLPADAGATAEDAAQGDAPEDLDALYHLVSPDGRKEYDMRQLLERVVDRDSLEESKPEYGQSLVTAYGRIGGKAVGVVANQRLRTTSAARGMQIGGVIYADAADKAARFVLDCNQACLPLVFLHDVLGFMVGRDAEQGGIIRSGAKLVNAVSNSIVPKLVVIVGGSFGAGNYAMCGRAYDPRFVFAWPGARCAVMGGEQAAETLVSIRLRGHAGASETERSALRAKIVAEYREHMDVRYAAARGWVDAIIAPHETRRVLIHALGLSARRTPDHPFKTGVIQT